MIATAREALRRRLSPQAYENARFLWWQNSFYLPRRAASVLIHRNPKVHGFPAGRESDLVREVRSINVFSPTEMCRAMTRHGSDKGHAYHNYTTVYSVLLGRFRGANIRIFELGLGTNNPKLVSSMGEHGLPGASLRGWRELFPRALVYGADIDREILFQEDRVQTFYCDQLDGAAIRHLWSKPVLSEGFDIIIDDGLHTFEANVSFLDGSLELLHPGGVFVVEDIIREALPLWEERLEGFYSRRYPNYEFALTELPNSFNGYDNNLLIIRRSA